ncbi:hypothetical protein ACHAXM_000408 [Skeletonema potamos]
MPKTNSVSIGGYARQIAFMPSSPNLHFAEYGLSHRRNTRPSISNDILHHHHSRFVLRSLSSPTAYCRTNALLNSHEREDGILEDTMDLLTDDEEKNADTNTYLPLTTVTNSHADISVLGIPLRSVILLNVVAVIWGTQHSVIKTVVDDSVIGLWNGSGFANWAEHVFGTRWEQLMSALQYSTNAENAAGIGAGAAAYFTLARFSIAALLASPYTPGVQQQKIDNDGEDSALVQSQSSTLDDTATQAEETNLAWKYGIELGIYMFLGYGFQAIGLQTTSASRSGFLLYLNVKLVPFFSYFLFGKTIQRSTWISALTAFGGTALLAFDNASAEQAGLDASFNVGDLWSIAAAAASALFILRMETASKAVPKSAELNAANLWTVAFLSLVWAAWVSFNNLHDEATMLTQTLPATLMQTLQKTFQQTIYTITANPVQLIYLSAVTTALANYIQSIAQKEISAERASVFYALDPVYGAAFANLLLGETLGWWGCVGAGLIVIAAATNAVWDFSPTDDGSGSNTDKQV